MSDKYLIKEVFWTLQGEGHHAGRPALFVRFGGCNMWSGLDQHRERDRDKSAVHCSMWCDTDFAGGDSMGLDELVEMILDRIPRAWREYAANRHTSNPMIVFTGGEPLLQLDERLLVSLLEKGSFYFAVETNGMTEPKPGVEKYLHWTCVSPKGRPEDMKIGRPGARVTHVNEVKVPFPCDTDLDPESYRSVMQSTHWTLTPIWEDPDDETHFKVPVSKRLHHGAEESIKASLSWLRHHPGWTLSVQVHKYIGVE